jgi:hypothetical protein
MAEENGKRRPLTQSEKFKNYCLGIAALTALILGLINILKGEPTAEKTWVILRDQTNSLTETVNKLTKQVIFLQAHESGRTAAKLELKLEEAEKKLSRLQSVKPALVSKSSSGSSRPAKLSKPQKKCKDGSVLADGRCRRVHKAVAKKMAQDEVEKVEARRRLLEEKKKRLEAERRKRTLMKQMTEPAPPKPIPKLPTKLDEASER